ncbi:DUF2268 domain-containing putative Zn-dependent protease [Flavisolibacter tropicus]|uniref:gliding motility protein GldB-related protein n=1 Tax=Flavisolibacter tropicus TaxID=1492898 RepID=UPI0009ED8ABD|nr:DUF2268 domain-containing putative Zn-dependent protease [Flavisolibacter tropicus]
MIKNKLLPLVLLFVSTCVHAQLKYSSNPDNSLFLYKDIDHFWEAFDAFKQDTTSNPFDSNYLQFRSAGIQAFLPNRIQSAEHLLNTVKARRADYEKVRENTLRISEKEKQCRSVFYALKYWYPEVQYPHVFFVIGAFNSGGTFSERGIFIGAEMQANLNNVPYVVAHELIHFQQKNWPENPTLLQQSIIEGSADFLGELISGAHINQKAQNYGNLHEEKLCREFISRMDSTQYIDWLYGVSGKDDRPNDLGYWIGYKITEQYYNKATDKRQAFEEILDIKDFKDFLRKSDYLEKYFK